MKNNLVDDALAKLSGDIPKPRMNLSEDEKLLLIQKIGPRTAKNIRLMRGKVAEARIPFLFSAIDTQIVVDLLANDCDALIDQAIKLSKPVKSKNKAG